jgi:hypothetical protein
LAWLLVPLAIAWIATATDLARIFLPRYLAASAPAAMILAAMCAALAPDRWGKLVVGVAILAGSVTILAVPMIRTGHVIQGRYEDWRGAVAWVNDEWPAHRYPVLVRSGLVESSALRLPHDTLLEDYCLLPVTSLYRLNVDRDDLVPLPSLNPGRIDGTLAARLHDRRGVWLVVRAGRRDAAEAAARQLVGRLRQATPARSASEEFRAEWHMAERHSFGGVHVFRLEVGP